MAWLSLLLFLPWFLLLGSLYWLFPRQPRTPRRRLFDGTTLLLAFALSIESMLWGYRLGMAQPGAGPIWPQVLAVLYAYIANEGDAWNWTLDYLKRKDVARYNALIGRLGLRR